MKVIVYGGPLDGEVYEINAGLKLFIVVPLPPQVQFLSREELDDIKPSPPRYMTVPIKRMKDSPNYVAYWAEGVVR